MYRVLLYLTPSPSASLPATAGGHQLMSQTVTTPETMPDPETIRENNAQVDRLVDGFETRVDRFLRRHRGKLHLLAFLLAVAWATPSFVTILLGVPLVIVGLALRTWASGYLVKNARLCTAGPYGLCRHPMYLANLIILAGILVAGNNIYMTATGVLLTIVVYVFAIRREEALLDYLFDEDYAQYRQTTPCLLPQLTRSHSTDATKRFSWTLAWYNSIGEQTGGVVLLLMLFAVKTTLLAHFGINYAVTYGLWLSPLG